MNMLSQHHICGLEFCNPYPILIMCVMWCMCHDRTSIALLIHNHAKCFLWIKNAFLDWFLHINHLIHISDVSQVRCPHRAQRILKGNSHPSHGLFTLLPSYHRYRSICCHITRLKSSFTPQAVRFINSPLFIIFSVNYFLYSFCVIIAYGTANRNISIQYCIELWI